MVLSSIPFLDTIDSSSPSKATSLSDLLSSKYGITYFWWILSWYTSYSGLTLMTQPHSHFLVSQIIILTLFKEIVWTSAYLILYCSPSLHMVCLCCMTVKDQVSHFLTLDFFISPRSTWNSLNKIAIVIRESYNRRKRTGFFTYFLYGTIWECDNPISSSPPEEDDSITEICSFFTCLATFKDVMHIMLPEGPRNAYHLCKM